MSAFRREAGRASSRDQVEFIPHRPENHEVEVVSEIPIRRGLGKKKENNRKDARPDADEEDEADHFGAVPLDVVEQLGELRRRNELNDGG